MKGILSLSIRCLDALLWSLGLSSVVLVLMIGFYVCWTIPLTKTESHTIAAKTIKPRIEAKSIVIKLDKNAVYADR